MDKNIGRNYGEISRETPRTAIGENNKKNFWDISNLWKLWK